MLLGFGDAEYEWCAEGEAGVSLQTGERWFGSRIRYRRVGSRRWRSLLVIDLHPFDVAGCELALRALLANERTKAASGAR